MSDPSYPSGHRLTTAWTVLAASLVLSLAIGLGAHVAIEERLESRFNAWVEDASGRLKSQIAAQEALIQGAAALFSSSPSPLAHGSFQAYVSRLDLDARYPGLRAIGLALWSPPVAGGRDGHLAGRAEVRFLEPSDSETTPWIGFDLETDAVRRDALARARDRGQPVLSGPIGLLRGGPGGPTPPVGFMLVQPVYADPPPTDARSRRARLLGFVIGLVAAKGFFSQVFGKDLEVPIALRVYDGAVAGDRLLFEDQGPAPWEAPSLRAERQIIASGRHFTLVAAARPTLVALSERLVAPALAAVGVGLSLLLFGLTRAQARARATAETTVDAMKRGEEVRAALLATERTARQEAQRLVLALERSNRELDQFAYVASHDLKSPLRGIANLATWIEEDLAGAVSDETRKNLDLLRGRVRRLEALIDGILSYSRAGRAEEAAEPVDVDALLREIVGLLAPPATAVIDIGAMPTLVTQKIALEQVLLNLIGNALKHGGRDDVRVTVSARPLDIGWEFSVGDDGPGIAPEYHGRVWQMFQTLQTRDQVEATGIGLAVVKKIVESRGGTVDLTSAPGAGTTFSFRWPPEGEASDTQALRRPGEGRSRSVPVRPLERVSSRTVS